MSVQHAPAAEPYVALPLRQHTIFGVCEGIGEDFGFNPIFLRVPLAASVLWSPLYAISAYLALGVFVLASVLESGMAAFDVNCDGIGEVS